jgi:hypothetical protein
MAEKQWCPGCSREVEGVCHHFNCAIGPNGLDAQSRSSAATIAPLLPCPFCGNKPAIEDRDLAGKAKTIFCAEHDCIGPSTTAASYDDAAMQWNRRAGAAQAVSKPSAELCAKVAEEQALIGWVNGEATTVVGRAYQRACRDVAAAIRAFAAQPPAAPVERSAPAAPTGDTRSGERPPASAAMGHSAGADTRCSAGTADLSEFRKLQDIIDNQADQILDLHEVLKSAYLLNEFIAGAYVLSLADFRYLNVVSTKIKAALPGGDVIPAHGSEVTRPEGKPHG